MSAGSTEKVLVIIYVDGRFDEIDLGHLAGKRRKFNVPRTKSLREVCEKLLKQPSHTAVEKLAVRTSDGVAAVMDKRIGEYVAPGAQEVSFTLASAAAIDDHRALQAVEPALEPSALETDMQPAEPPAELPAAVAAEQPAKEPAEQSAEQLVEQPAEPPAVNAASGGSAAAVREEQPEGGGTGENLDLARELELAMDEDLTEPTGAGIEAHEAVQLSGEDREVQPAEAGQNTSGLRDPEAPQSVGLADGDRLSGIGGEDLGVHRAELTVPQSLGSRDEEASGQAKENVPRPALQPESQQSGQAAVVEAAAPQLDGEAFFPSSEDEAAEKPERLVAEPAVERTARRESGSGSERRRSRSRSRTLERPRRTFWRAGWQSQGTARPAWNNNWTRSATVAPPGGEKPNPSRGRGARPQRWGPATTRRGHSAPQRPGFAWEWSGPPCPTVWECRNCSNTNHADDEECLKCCARYSGEECRRRKRPHSEHEQVKAATARKRRPRAQQSPKEKDDGSVGPSPQVTPRSRTRAQPDFTPDSKQVSPANPTALTRSTSLPRFGLVDSCRRKLQELYKRRGEDAGVWRQTVAPRLTLLTNDDLAVIMKDDTSPPQKRNAAELRPAASRAKPSKEPGEKVRAKPKKKPQADPPVDHRTSRICTSLAAAIDSALTE